MKRKAKRRGVYPSDGEELRKARGEQRANLRVNPEDWERLQAKYPGLTLIEILNVWKAQALA